MNTTLPHATNSTLAPSHDDIAQYARERWMEAGQPQGRDDEFWLEAERLLNSARHEPDVTAMILATLGQPVTHRS